MTFIGLQKESWVAKQKKCCQQTEETGLEPCAGVAMKLEGWG